MTFEIGTEFTVLHDIYVISFSILYAVMLHSIRGLKVFDATSAFTGDPRPIRRFIASVTILNVLPFVHFAVILLYLIQNLPLNIFSVMLMFVLSISVFGFDKLLDCIIVRNPKLLYTEKELERIKYDERVGIKLSRHYSQFLVPGLLYIFIPTGLLAIIFSLAAGLAILSASVAGGFLAWYRWRANLND